VAVDAVDGVNVEGAFWELKREIILSTVMPQLEKRGWQVALEATALMSWVSVATEATQAFVDACGGAVVAGAGLVGSVHDSGDVELVTEGLALVFAHLDSAVAGHDNGQGHAADADVELGAVIEEGEGQGDCQGSCEDHACNSDISTVWSRRFAFRF